MSHTEENQSDESTKALKALDELVEILHREDIEFTDDEGLRAESSRDASIFTKTPQIIIYPRNSGEIGTIVRSIQRPLSLSTRAGGTCMTGAPLTDSVLLNLTKHMGYIEVDPKSKTAIVEMGAMYRDIETKTMVHNLYLASYPSSREICGIGGMIGNNASGEKSLRYGATIDNVISVKAVLNDGFEYEFGELNEEDFIKKTKSEGLEGEIYASVYESLLEHKKAVGDLTAKHPVKKCASGYRIDKVQSARKKADNAKQDATNQGIAGEDSAKLNGTLENIYNLASLFVGSQSTLGIITEAKIRLTRKQEHRKLIFMGVKELSELPVILKTILSHDPESVETFDIHTFERAKTFHPEYTNRVENFINEGIAKLTNSPSPKNESIKKYGYNLFVLAEFAGDIQDVVFEQAKDTTKELNSLHDLHVFNIDHDDLETYSSIWNIRRTSFAVMRDYKDGTKHAVPCIEDVIVPTTKFDVFIPKLISILNEQNIFFGFHGHIGDGSLRIIPVFDLADPEVVTKIDTLCRAVFELIKGLGGNMSADHSDGIIRTPYLREFYGDEIYNIFMSIKNAFDPENIFNPGKKIGGTIEDIKKSIIEV